MRDIRIVVSVEIASDLEGIDKKRYCVCVNLLSEKRQSWRESWYTIQGLKRVDNEG